MKTFQNEKHSKIKSISKIFTKEVRGKDMGWVDLKTLGGYLVFTLMSTKVFLGKQLVFTAKMSFFPAKVSFSSKNVHFKEIDAFFSNSYWDSLANSF